MADGDEMSMAMVSDESGANVYCGLMMDRKLYSMSNIIGEFFLPAAKHSELFDTGMRAVHKQAHNVVYRNLKNSNPLSADIDGHTYLLQYKNSHALQFWEQGKEKIEVCIPYNVTYTYWLSYWEEKDRLIISKMLKE